jgi:hypothetical protein
VNATEAARLLQKRAQLTRVGYVTDTVNAWTQALSDITYPEAETALLALTEAGETNITVPAIRTHFRKTHTPPPTPSPSRDIGCQCRPSAPGQPHGSICDMHRSIGIDAIARIRAQKHSRTTPPPKDAA